MNKKPSFFGLSEEEHKEIVRKAVRKANKEQRELVKKYDKTYMNEEELKIVDAMSTYGGSFVKALAECFYKADPINFVKLQTTFSKYWEQYKKIIK